MSQKERTRVGVMKQVKAGQLSVVAAADLMEVSYRQAKRVWRRYRDLGDAGLVHLGRGKAGAIGARMPRSESGYWLGIRSAIRTLGRPWRRSIWTRKG